jgi:hypothetical protein
VKTTTIETKTGPSYKEVREKEENVGVKAEITRKERKIKLVRKP